MGPGSCIDLGRLVPGVLPTHPFHSLQETPDEFTQKIMGFERILAGQGVSRFKIIKSTRCVPCPALDLDSHFFV